MGLMPAVQSISQYLSSGCYDDFLLQVFTFEPMLQGASAEAA